MSSTTLDPIEPTAQDARLAAEAVSRLSDGTLVISELPEIAVKLLSQVLSVLADGRSFTVQPLDSDYTPNQAADFLNVSRPYVLKLLNEGQLPFHHVGSHKRIHLRDLRAYRQRQDDASEKALAELAAQAQEFNMG